MIRQMKSFCLHRKLWCDACFRNSAAKVFVDVNCETISLCSNFPSHCRHFASVQFLSPQHLIDGYLAIANNLQVPLENNLTVRLTVTVKPPKKCHVKDIEKSHFSIPLLMWRISFSSLSSLISNIRSLCLKCPNLQIHIYFLSCTCHEMNKCLEHPWAILFFFRYTRYFNDISFRCNISRYFHDIFQL